MSRSSKDHLLISSSKERLSSSGNAYILYLYYLASNGAAAALEKLCSLAFGAADATSKYGLSDSAKSTCKTHLESAFAKASRSTGNLDQVCQAVASMKPDSVVDLDEEVAAQQKLALKSLKGLLKSNDADAEDKKLTQAVALLHAVALFQIYSHAPGAEALLIGVNTFYESYKGGADQETWQLLIVKVLLPMVHRPSSLGRLVSKHVFECFVGKLDAEAMQVLVERLEFSEDLTGYNELLGDINADDESDEEEFEGELGGEDASDDGEEGDDESGEDSDVDMDGDDGQLLKSLGSHLLNGEGEKSMENGKKEKKEKKGKKGEKKDEKKDDDDEGSDSDGSDMTDSEMMAINDKLVEAFDHISGNNPESKEAKEAKTFVLNFQNRTLALVEADLNRQPTNTAVIFPILPDLVRLSARTTSSDLRARVVELLSRYRKRFVKERKRWVDEGHGTDAKENLAALEQVHEEIGSRDSQKFAKGASAACLVIAAAVVAMDRDKIGELNRMHERLEGEMKGKRNKVHKSFFETWKGYQQSVCNGAEQT